MTGWAAILLWALLALAPSARAAVLTGATWQVTGTDANGTTWGGSTLVFTQQKFELNGDASLLGYFDWIGSGGQSGREFFDGTYFSYGQVNLYGTSLLDPVGIVTAVYTAVLSADGNSLSGSWSGPNVVPGTFVADRLVAPIPLPAGLPLIATSLLALAIAARQSRA
jgi:hypothetical protein